MGVVICIGCVLFFLSILLIFKKKYIYGLILFLISICINYYGYILLTHVKAELEDNSKSAFIMYNIYYYETPKDTTNTSKK